eukprot:scaffold1638_cov258-Pinguiococcus_pyrenoidosus.AAC.56
MEPKVESKKRAESVALDEVVGRKLVCLYQATRSSEMYRTEGTLFNTSQVDPEGVDRERFPDFPAVPDLWTVLDEGEMLFIPYGCWHYIRALDNAFSVSFWWARREWEAKGSAGVADSSTKGAAVDRELAAAGPKNES